LPCPPMVTHSDGSVVSEKGSSPKSVMAFEGL
jgi:hypothetical protein